MTDIRELGPEDEVWLKELWKASRVFGQDAAPIWRAVHQRSNREQLIGIREQCFVHFRRRRDGINVVYEIAVAEAHRRKGLGKRLLQAVGAPIMLKTDADNTTSRAFYVALGFRELNTIVAKHSSKAMVNYLWEGEL
jgi:GNAT superfamily N-acetyltransferase